MAPGIRLGRYEITAPLGAGGMGEAYRAKDTRLGRDVSVKVLPAHLMTRHGGSISAQLAPGGGLIVTFVLPALGGE